MNKKKQIVYVDMDNVLVDFMTGVDRVKKIDSEIIEQYKGNLDEIPGIFSKMDPIEGAIEGYKFLASNFDTYILSTAPWENASAWSDKLDWVHKYLGDVAHKRLILTHNKNLNKGDFLIDDRPNNGASEFEGELIAFTKDSYPNWTSVIEYMKSKLA